MIPNQDLREVPDEQWVIDGRWQGPRDLRYFLRVNWPFAAFYWVVLTFMVAGFIKVEVGIPGVFAIPFGFLAGTSVTLLIMFLFSRGWIAEGD